VKAVLTLGPLAIALTVAILGWNVSRFSGARPIARTKDLDFLPAPIVGELLSLGHRGTMAKLRWIDSFSYFSLQLDRRDDAISGAGPGRFERLYDTLIALDPQFAPFYQHAELCTGGLLGRHDLALRYCLLGTVNLPHEGGLWQSAAAIMTVNFQLEVKNPRVFDAYLSAWETAELDPDRKGYVQNWKRMMARRRFSGLEQLPYWIDLLQRSPPDTPAGQYVDTVVREQLSAYGVAELQALADAAKAAGSVVTDPAALLDPARLTARYRGATNRFLPFTLVDGVAVLRHDPWGHAWRLLDGKVISPGLERQHYEKLISNLTIQIAEKARQIGRRPERLEELPGLGLTIPPVPAGGTVTMDRESGLIVTWQQAPQPPWPLLAR